MQISQIPMNLLNELDKICRSFVWGHDFNVRGFHPIEWDTLFRHRSCGGLGLHSMKLLNKTTLAKLAWQFLHEEDKLWVRVLHSKYGRGDDGLVSLSPIQGSSFVWRGLVSASPLVTEGVGWSVENRKQVKFGSTHGLFLNRWVRWSMLSFLRKRWFIQWSPIGMRASGILSSLRTNFLMMSCGFSMRWPLDQMRGP